MPSTNVTCTAQLSVNPTVQQLSDFRKELRKVLGSEKYDLTCKADAAGAVHLKISYRLTDPLDGRHVVTMSAAIHSIDPYCSVTVADDNPTGTPPAQAGAGEGKPE